MPRLPLYAAQWLTPLIVHPAILQGLLPSNHVQLWLMKYHPSNPNIYSSVSADVTKFGSTTDERWHSLTGMRRGGFLRIYFDGQFVHQERDLTGPLEFENGSTFFLGRADSHFRGALSNVRMWTQALDDDQVAALAKGAPMSAVFGESSVVSALASVSSSHLPALPNVQTLRSVRTACTFSRTVAWRPLACSR